VNSPSPVVTVVELTLVATFVAVTVTPGSTPPDLSLTLPVMAPRNSCPAAVAATASAIASAANVFISSS